MAGVYNCSLGGAYVAALPSVISVYWQLLLNYLPSAGAENRRYFYWCFGSTWAPWHLVLKVWHFSYTRSIPGGSLVYNDWCVQYILDIYPASWALLPSLPFTLFESWWMHVSQNYILWTHYVCCIWTSACVKVAYNVSVWHANTVFSVSHASTVLNVSHANTVLSARLYSIYNLFCCTIKLPLLSIHSILHFVTIH